MTDSPTMEVVLQRLTPAQQKVAAALLQGATVKDAAEANGLHRTTVHTWCRSNPTFQSALDEARRIQAAWIADETHALVMEAFEQIRRTLRNERISESIRLAAALAVIDRAARIGGAREPDAVTDIKLKAIRGMMREMDATQTQRVGG